MKHLGLGNIECWLASLCRVVGIYHALALIIKIQYMEMKKNNIFFSLEEACIFKKIGPPFPRLCGG